MGFNTLSSSGWLVGGLVLFQKLLSYSKEVTNFADSELLYTKYVIFYSIKYII